MSPQPTRISRYEIKGLIAQGGMGDLYLARDPNTGRLVVVKLLNATLDSDDVHGRFEREARALASLSHPNVVHIYDYGDFHGAPFIVMEYVRGETLAEKIHRQAPMSVAQKLTLMTELCSGLAQAHEAGIIHRDVKPANLMVDQDGRLKILDFGIARVADSNLTRMSFGLSQGSMQIGTPGYMSPEQIQGDEIDHRTDVFAVGAVCYELLSNREAFPGANTREVEAQVMQARPTPPASLVPGLDPEIDKIVTRALAKDRHQRYQSVAQLGEALEGYRLRLGPSETSPLSSTPRSQDHERRPHASRGEAAYQRSLAAFQDGVRDAARRFAIEALAEDPDHAGARALLARFEPERRPTAPPRPARPPVPPPPTALRTSLSAGVPPAPDPPTLLGEPIDSTVVIPRPQRPASPTRTDETVFSTRANWTPAPSSTDETVFIPRKARPAPVTPPAAAVTRTDRPAPSPQKRRERLWTGLQPLWTGLQPLWTRWKALRERRQPPRRGQGPVRGGSGALWNLYGRSVLLVAALVVLVAGTLLVAIRLSDWIWPSGQLLTITKPVGGTISTGGIRCGTRGSDCSTERVDGDPVELEAEPDEGFAFSGFTGDCAPTGRTAMAGPRTCGATFEPLQAGAKATVWPLTISPPKGGTILAAGGIQCGSLASECSASLPDGVPVTLHVIADPGYAFLNYTDECAPSGQTMMTGPRTCSATFTPSVAEAAPRSTAPVAPPRTPRPPPAVIEPPRATVAVEAPPPPPATTDPGAPSEPPVVAGTTPAPPPITPEAHAKNEIPGIVKEYCAGLEALEPARIQKVYPTVNVRALQEQFRQYKSLKCMLTGPPEFVQLDAVAGTAKVEVGVKQTIEMRSGGAPKTLETIAETTLLRPELRSSWRIGNVIHKAKPKP